MPRIMIVDDEPYIIQSLKKVLEKEGFNVVGAENGSECLKKLQQEPVDLILMDFFMPKMDGRMVIEKIRGMPKLKDTKIAFLTSASFGERGMEVLKELNILYYFTKPIDIDDFTSRIKNLLKR